MSESNLPPPPDDEDRELEAFLARRSELSRLYRETAAPETAPAALDAAVLAAANAAVAIAPPRRQTRLHRWRLPLSLAASMLVGIGLLREVRQDPALQQQLSGEAAAVAAHAKAEQRAAAPGAAPPVVASPPAPGEFSAASPPQAMPSERAGPEVRALRKEKRLPPALLESPVRGAPALAEAPAPIDTPALQPGLEAGGASSDRSAESPEVPAAEPAQVQKRAPMRQDEAGAMPSPLPPQAAASAAAPASAPVAAANAAVVEAWQPARYQGRTLAVWAREHAAVTVAPSTAGKIAAEAMADAVVNEGDVAWIDYGHAVDPRGALRGRLAADRQLALLSLNLSPALPLSVVEASEQLGRADAACADRRRYPAQGIELRLDAEGRVAEIRYHRLPPPACR